MVPLTGLEPVRILLRGILSPLCLPIPPQRRTINIITLFWQNVNIFLQPAGKGEIIYCISFCLDTENL